MTTTFHTNYRKILSTNYNVVKLSTYVILIGDDKTKPRRKQVTIFPEPESPRIPPPQPIRSFMENSQKFQKGNEASVQNIGQKKSVELDVSQEEEIEQIRSIQADTLRTQVRFPLFFWTLWIFIRYYFRLKYNL